MFSIAVGIPGTFQGTVGRVTSVQGRKGRNVEMGLTVSLPATPCLRKMLEDGLGLVLLDTLGHHVENVVHDGSSELEVEVGLDPLLRDRLGDTEDAHASVRERRRGGTKKRRTPWSSFPQTDERASFRAIARGEGRYHGGRTTKPSIQAPRIRLQVPFRRVQS
jgi:hypothetical protein